jgi:UrcA family protein
MGKFTISLTIASALILTVAPTTGLTQAPAASTARISFVGLNLAAPADAAKFAERVSAAAEDVCHDMARGNPSGAFSMAGCKVAIRRQAMSQLSRNQRQNLRIAARANATSIAVAAR